MQTWDCNLIPAMALDEFIESSISQQFFDTPICAISVFLELSINLKIESPINKIRKNIAHKGSTL